MASIKEITLSRPAGTADGFPLPSESPEELGLSSSECAILPMLEVAKGLPEAHNPRLRALWKEDGRRVELAVTQIAADDLAFQWMALRPLPALRPVEHHQAAVEPWQPLLLDMRLPVGTAGVDEEAVLSGPRPLGFELAP